MNEAQVMALVADVLGIPPLSATHQTFGHNSITYDVALPERHVIVRLNADAQVFATTEHNLAVLSELGLPVSKVLTVDNTKSRCPLAYMILEKIPGRDLRYELSAMTQTQMTRLAEQIVGFQRRVGMLPPGSGYGYVGIGEPGPYASWWELIRPGESVLPAGETKDDICTWRTHVQRRVTEFAWYFRAVPPTCFLDDVTVKNVMVQNGELQGLIDFDCVCYGDPLFWLALTAVGLVSDVGTRELFYVEELKRFWGLTPMQEQVLALYSAGFALDFLRRFSTAETPEWSARMRTTCAQWITLTDSRPPGTPAPVIY